MRPAMERGVPLEERHQVALGSLTDWDAARIFLEVVRCGAGNRISPTYACAVDGRKIIPLEIDLAVLPSR